jgi:hypothetical protein
MSFSQLLLAWSGTKIETRGSGPTSRVACPCPVRSSAIKMSPESYVLGSGNESFRDSLPDQWSSHAFQVRGNGRLFHEK